MGVFQLENHIEVYMTNSTDNRSVVLGNIKVMLKDVKHTQSLHTQKFDIHTDLLEDLKSRMEHQEKLSTQIIDILVSMNSVLTQMSSVLTQLSTDMEAMKTDMAIIKKDITETH